MGEIPRKTSQTLFRPTQNPHGVTEMQTRDPNSERQSLKPRSSCTFHMLFKFWTPLYIILLLLHVYIEYVMFFLEICGGKNDGFWSGLEMDKSRLEQHSGSRIFGTLPFHLVRMVMDHSNSY